MIRVFEGIRNPARKKPSGLPVSFQPGEGSREDHLSLLGDWPENLQQVEAIDCRLRPEKRILARDDNKSLGAENFRFLSHRLHSIRQRRALGKLLVTSSVPEEGKTVVTVNLASILTRSSQRVLLIDADMRRPGVDRALEIPAIPGLADCLEGRITIGESLRRLDPMGLYYVAAGSPETNPVELLQGARMAELLKKAAATFEWVVVDTPPLLPFADAHCIATHADAVVLVARSGVTTRQNFQQALAALEGSYVAGVVLNGRDEPQQQSYYSRYTRRDEKQAKADAQAVEEAKGE